MPELLPWMAVRTRDAIEDGSAAVLHHWCGRVESAFRCTQKTPGLRIDCACLFAGDERGYRRVPWRDTFLLEVIDGDRYIDAHRLYDLPHRLAKELADELEQHTGDVERETYELRDSLQRAFASRPWGFNRAAYAPSFIEQLEARAGDTALKLAEGPDSDVAPALERAPSKRHDPTDPAWLETLDQLGLRIREDGRMVHSGHPPGAWLQGPERPHGPGVGHIEYWAERLRQLDGEHGGYVNSVPVRRLPCSPLRFEVALYELSAEVGLGTGGRQRITRTCTLYETAALVQRGLCPHHKYSRASDRWSEVG